MNKVNLAVPTRWNAGTQKIKQWLEKQAREAGAELIIEPVQQIDPGQIYITNPETLSQGAWELCTKLIGPINSHLNCADPRESEVQKNLDDYFSASEKELRQMSADFDRSIAASAN